jgi:transcriptional regulator with XRE-family HTH domain
VTFALSAPRLRSAREAAGLSRQAAAEAVRVSISTLQAAERGDHELRASTLAALSVLYGIDLWSLFDGHAVDGEAPLRPAPPPNGGEMPAPPVNEEAA